MGMRRNLNLNWGTDSEEFKHFVGREPTREELNQFVHNIKKGIEGQVDWDILLKCAAEEFK